MTITTTTKRYKSGVLISTEVDKGAAFKMNVLCSVEKWREWGSIVEVTYSPRGKATEVSFSHPDSLLSATYSFT